jgi:outer membrane protein OmpA-like peptidoglycan-associated protein
MIGSVVVRGRRGRDEAEKPFWISYSDLMTALMVLFLVVMSVALLAVTKTVDEAAQRKQARDDAIEELLDDLEEATKAFPGITVDRARQAIDFGERARFRFDSADLSGDQQRQLREFVPEILRIAGTERGHRWLKRVVVEGFTDQKGTYLYNLNLSLRRSQSVLCALFAPPLPDEPGLSVEEKERIRALFLVGGYSSNSARPTDEESRRIELRLEFYGLGEEPGKTAGLETGNFGTCAMR